MTFSTANQSDLNSVHQANLLSQLSRRLEVARAHHNPLLVAALECEYAQLTSTAEPVTLGDRLQQLWLSFSGTLSDWTKVHIEQTVDAKGKPCWYAYNPQAGQAIFTESESEMRQWINTGYWGR
ncbi:MAG: hypothetical protein AAFY54_05785 [Cyanobacteria bacterium J06648_10]